MHSSLWEQWNVDDPPTRIRYSKYIYVSSGVHLRALYSNAMGHMQSLEISLRFKFLNATPVYIIKFFRIRMKADPTPLICCVIHIITLARNIGVDLLVNT